MSHSGEEKAWEILSGLDPKTTESRTGAVFNSENSSYELKCFGQEVHVSLKDKVITAVSDIGKLIVNDLGEYSRLAILNYLTSAKDIPLSGELVRPADLSGGGIFVRGTHVVPIDNVAETFGDDQEKLLNVGKELGGLRREYGDVSVELLPFRRVPVTIVLWAGDEDFPAKASLLLDSTCTLQVPVDILWSTAMMVVKAIMKDEQCGDSCCGL